MSQINTYTAGALIEVTGNFVDEVTGQPADPSVVKVSWSVNNAAKSTYTYGTDSQLVRTGIGAYYAYLDTTGLPGNWWYQWQGTGGVQAIAYSGFLVVESPVMVGGI